MTTKKQKRMLKKKNRQRARRVVEQRRGLPRPASRPVPQPVSPPALAEAVAKLLGPLGSVRAVPPRVVVQAEQMRRLLGTGADAGAAKIPLSDALTERQA